MFNKLANLPDFYSAWDITETETTEERTEIGEIGIWTKEKGIAAIDSFSKHSLVL